MFEQSSPYLFKIKSLHIHFPNERCKAIFYILIWIFIGQAIGLPCSANRPRARKPASPYPAIESYFRNLKHEGVFAITPVKLDSVRVRTDEQTFNVYGNDGFAAQNFTPELVNTLYKEIQALVPSQYASYKLNVYASNLEISEWIPNVLRENKDLSRLPKQKYIGKPWIQRISRPMKFEKGLQDKHLMIWPSHGSYWLNEEQKWDWQRPSLYCTTEDMFTLSIVTPFLIPMLENSGAICYTPRERDWQKQEIIVDNSDANHYTETQGKWAWATSPTEGFQNSRASYYIDESPFKAKQRVHYERFIADSAAYDSTNIFELRAVQPDTIFPGNARWTQTVSSEEAPSLCTWTPNIQQEGDYAVYCTYQSFGNSTDEAIYTITHQGEQTQVAVNQQMGGSTWVYLGTYHFGCGQSTQNCVTLTNQSSRLEAIVSADAIRFGGGMGNTLRQENKDYEKVSGLPRFLESASYWLQYSGFPTSVTNTQDGQNDYKNDLYARPLALNWLASGSCQVPDTIGGHVPFDLTLAIHSDAGYKTNNTPYGTLVISTLKNDTCGTTFKNGMNRLASSDFAAILHNQIIADLNASLNCAWPRREHLRRNYCETRVPEVPSAIIETLSHQNFKDMQYGHSPQFKFLMARSIYKGILQFLSTQYNVPAVVQPLPVVDFAAILQGNNQVRLSWKPQTDPLEKTANPSGYIIYTRKGDGGFDNGTLVGNATEYLVTITPDEVYSFKIAAVNEGGESFPSESLCVCQTSQAVQQALIVNGFTRLSGPATIENEEKLGFDIELDPGVPYMKTPEYCGVQTSFLRRNISRNNYDRLGQSDNSLEGKIIHGNTFDFAVYHGKSLKENKLSFSSISRSAFENGIDLKPYTVLDLMMGLQKKDKIQGLYNYEIYTPAMQQQLQNYLNQGGLLFISGAYLRSGLSNSTEIIFAKNTLKYSGLETNPTSVEQGAVFNLECAGKQQAIKSVETHIDQKQYALHHIDRLQPETGAKSIAFDQFHKPIGTCYQSGNQKIVTLSIPFESITQADERDQLMRSILSQENP